MHPGRWGMTIKKRILAFVKEYLSRKTLGGFSPVPYRIPYSRFSKAVCDAVRDNRDEIGRKVIVPNEVHLYCSPEDREARRTFEDILISELRDELAAASHEWNSKITPDFFNLKLYTDSSLEAGECYADSFFRSPGEENHRAAPVKGETLLEPPECEAEGKEMNNVPESEMPEASCEKSFEPFIHDDYYKKTCKTWNPWKEGKAGCMVRVAGPGTSHSFLAPEGRWYIGRGKACQVILASTDKKISRRHVEVDVSAGAIRIRCLGLNGALINDRELTMDEWIHAQPGDSLFIGAYQLKLLKAKFA